MTDFQSADLADFHNHLLPAVDDGARSLDETLRHLAALRTEGVTRLAVSPHVDARLAHQPGALADRLDRLEAAFHELAAACAGRADLPTLLFAQEILAPDPATATAAFADPRLRIADTPYALVEFGFDLPDDPAGVLRAVRAAGRQPVVAHAERYRRGGQPVSLDEIRAWKEAGALLQINAGSMLGGYGTAIETLAWQLLAEGLADTFATDHHGDARIVSPAAAARTLAARGASAQARLLLSENPRRILDGRPTLAVPPWPERAAA